MCILKVVLIREELETKRSCVSSVLCGNYPYPSTADENGPPESNSALLTIKFTDEIECPTYHFLARRENRIGTTGEKTDEEESIDRIEINNTPRL